MLEESVALTRLIKAAVDEILQSGDGLPFVGALSPEEDVGSLSSSEEEQAENALSVDLVRSPPKRDPGFESARRLHEFGCGSRVQAQAVSEDEFFFDHGRLCSFSMISEAARMAFRPLSTSRRAMECGSFPSRASVRAFISMGRLTPDTISTVPRSR